ncbi:hypothetical protein LOC67_03360 [Stieleria sp. JC731]|uniref:pilus assembly FimT family protein n=1 Tax=Pirellulaceae TaxID=2691357 RepID=UPI001E458AF4|nr:hypothetical protein [Stieleria sp. JC731]MCC9599586.1 hypothetical protein [Stieleria sp. JC731]
MKSLSSKPTKTSERMAYRIRRRPGFALLEVVTAIGLIVSLMAIATPMAIRSIRVWKDAQRYQLATDELSAQLDRLIALDKEDRQVAMEKLVVDQSVSRQLPDASISGELRTVNGEQRIELSLDWTRLGDPPPIKLVGWVVVITNTPSTASSEEDPS